MGKFVKKYNQYDLSGEYGIGYTSKGEPFYFDIEDYDKIKNHCWHINSKGYVQTNIDGNTVKIHRLILPDYQYVDHINHMKFDNRKCNLRRTTNQQNCMNKNIYNNNTSGIAGVSWRKRDKVWQARIKVNYKYIYLGQFKNFDDAVKARKEAEEKYFGEYSFDNSMKQSETNNVIH